LSLRLCAKRFGKCERVYTDRGAAATAWRDVTSCEQFLDEQLIDHSLRKAHRPQGGGKIESVIGTVQRELWEVVQFDSVEEPERALVKFLPTIVTAARTWGSAAWCPPGRMGRAGSSGSRAFVVVTLRSDPRRRPTRAVRDGPRGACEPVQWLAADDGACAPRSCD
jgi:transposase InsO family protein